MAWRQQPLSLRTRKMKRSLPQNPSQCNESWATMNSNFRYEIVLYWSQADESFIAEVPELPGCAADGATYQEAVANAEVVIREWIETAKELGRTIPTPRGRLMYA